MTCAFALLLLPLPVPAQEPAPAKLRCQVLDDAGAPRVGVHVLGLLRRGQEAPARCDVLTQGDDAIASLPWTVGDKGTIELRLLVAGIEPRRVVDLARATAEPVTMRLPPVGSLAITFTLADGSPLPPALANAISAFVPVPSTRVGDTETNLTSTPRNGTAMLQPIALDVPLQVHIGGVPLIVERSEPALTKSAPERAITWSLPGDVVLLQGRLQVPAGVDASKVRFTVQVSGDRGGPLWHRYNSSQLFVAADNSFAFVLPADWQAATARFEIRQQAGHASSTLPERILIAGNNDLGTVDLRAEPELLNGQVLLDDKPAPKTFVLGWHVRTPKPDFLRLPQVVPIGDDGRFRLVGADAGDGTVVLGCPDWHYRIEAPAEFRAGTQNAVIHVTTQAVLGLDVQLDDAALGDARWLGVALRRPSDNHDFPSLLTPKPDTAGVVQAGWPGKAGGAFVLRAWLTVTGEVLCEGTENIDIELPRLSTSRQLPALDLRGKLHKLHLVTDAPPVQREHWWRQLRIRRSGTTEWRGGNFQPVFDCLAGGPVDVAVFGEDLWLERADNILGEHHLTPRPAAAVSIKLSTPPPRQGGLDLRIRGRAELCESGAEFDNMLRPGGVMSSPVAADGTALLGCGLPGNWKLQLIARLPGGKEIELGDEATLHLESREPRAFELKLRPSDYDALPK